MYVTTIRIPDELAEAVKLYCSRTGASVNGAVVVALERLVAADANLARLESGLPGRENSNAGAAECPEAPALLAEVAASPPRPASPGFTGFCRATGCLKRATVDGFCGEHAE